MLSLDVDSEWAVKYLSIVELEDYNKHITPDVIPIFRVICIDRPILSIKILHNTIDDCYIIYSKDIAISLMDFKKVVKAYLSSLKEVNDE